MIAKIYQLFFQELIRYVTKMTCDKAAAEDIVQEVFEKIWKKSTRIDERASIDSYLFVAVRNACFTF